MRKTLVILTLLLALGVAALLLMLGVSVWRAARLDDLTAQRRRELEWRAIDLRETGRRQYAAGNYVQARETCAEALEIRRALYPKKDFPQGHPDLAVSINNLSQAYQAAGEYGRAEPLLKEALAMFRALYPREQFPQGHPDLAGSINNLATLHYFAGEYAKAEPLHREALAMRRALFSEEQYPQGHPDLADSINNLAALHLFAGEHGRAKPLFEEVLAMHRALYPEAQYPQGHPRLALSIDNLAGLHRMMGEYGQAEPLCQEALAMYRALYPRDKYPQGHPDLATSLHNLATLQEDAGAYGQAEPLFREAVDMWRALFPKDKYLQGHPLLAQSINNLAALYKTTGAYGQAVSRYREALEMSRGLALRYADLLAEAEALNYVATQPATRDGLLSASRHHPGAAVYDALWDGRAALTRLQERRHRDLMASRDPETASLADPLRRARSDLARRLLRPVGDPDQQRAAVQQLTDAKEELEKRIAARLQLAPQTAATSPTTKQLAQALPQGTAFIDLYRYTDLEQNPDVKGTKGEKSTPRYVAFVMLPDQAAVRVELKEAAPIERAWAAWHGAIVADRPDAAAERLAAARFAERVWQPVRAVLPTGLKTLYLVPDGELHQVPWGALPGPTPDSVLLDECAVCLVPHGPSLLERLQAPPGARAGDTLLAYGGIDYENDPAAVARHEDVRGPLLRDHRLRWTDLPGTAKEQQQVVALARKVLNADPIGRSGHQANTKQLEDDLPRARYAHLATHGFFADPAFRSAIQVEEQFQQTSKDRRSGARSPLVLSGLVLAGANRRGPEAADDRGIITAEGLIALRLEGLELAVLSACETGLGAYGGGEGVYGLQRAFHVAGCKGVVASLWKVDDGATQALMALFYRNLWERKLDAAEALRQAQLTLYRHPEAVQVAATRGVDFNESDLPQVEVKPAAKPRRSPTAYWAAFTFSGVRKASA